MSKKRKPNVQKPLTVWIIENLVVSMISVIGVIWILRTRFVGLGILLACAKVVAVIIASISWKGLVDMLMRESVNALVQEVDKKEEKALSKNVSEMTTDDIILAYEANRKKKPLLNERLYRCMEILNSFDEKKERLKELFDVNNIEVIAVNEAFTTLEKIMDVNSKKILLVANVWNPETAKNADRNEKYKAMYSKQSERIDEMMEVMELTLESAESVIMNSLDYITDRKYGGADSKQGVKHITEIMEKVLTEAENKGGLEL